MKSKKNSEIEEMIRIGKRNKLIEALKAICEDDDKEMHEIIGWVVLRYYEEIFEKGKLLNHKRTLARKMSKVELLGELVQCINTIYSKNQSSY